MDLKDKTVMITGASRGLGQAMAQRLARCGARLALVDLQEQQLEDTLQSCRALGVQARGYACNVADEDEVKQAFDRVQQDLGRIDGLVNNAGVTADALLVKRRGDEIDTLSLRDFQKVLDVDLTGVFLCGREAAARFVRGGQGGVIVNISSIAQAGNPGQSNYAAAKAGVTAMTVTWAQELARHGIRVAGIAPGFTATAMVGQMRQDVQDRIVARIPLRRFAQPQEIAHALQFIFENDYFHGRILEVDGGLRL